MQRDEGGRGIGSLTRPGQLLDAAELLMGGGTDGSKGTVILTGFPCLRDRTPPVESDGPPGAVALAFTLLALGRAPVTMPIEDHSVDVLRRCAAALPATTHPPVVASFPTADRWTPADDERLSALRTGAASVLSIERAGNSADGTCYTMRGYPMGDSLLGRINEIATPGCGVPTIGIGDGGNELGMGSLHAEVCQAVPLGDKIGCVIAADAPLVASVSNWGGYALCCAVALLSWDDQHVQALDGEAGGAPTPEAHLSRLVMDRAVAAQVHSAMNEAGALDGITSAGDGSVDGMPLEAQLVVLDELRAIALEAMQQGER